MVHFGLRPWEIAKLTPLQQQFYIAHYMRQMEDLEK
jgi:hypothetical protein